MTRKLFGTDGVRGTANSEPITAETALKLAMAAGAQFTCGAHRHKVVIGKDTRLSGYLLEPALTAGFISVGMDVVLLGPLPTPAVGMLTRSLRADLGVMISASHNPFQDNGIKLFGPDGFKLSDEVELEIERRIDNGLSDARAQPQQLGRGTPPGRRARALHRVRQGLLPSRSQPRRPEGCGRLCEWRGLPRRADRALRTRRGGRRPRRRAQRPQHQP